MSVAKAVLEAFVYVVIALIVDSTRYIEVQICNRDEGGDTLLNLTPKNVEA